MRRRRWMDAAGLLLIVTGLGLALVGAGSVAVDDWQQQQLNRQWERELRSLPPPDRPAVAGAPGGAGAAGAGTPRATPGAPGRRAGSPPRSDAVFALRIPKLGYYAAVRQGVTLGVLGIGPGHYPTTAWPGQRGNVGVAAHNVFWLQFDRLRPGDQILVEARDGTYRYRVTGSRVISPDDSSVLAAGGPNRLTLTTCWPLWAGALAPRRFAISAVQEP